MSKIGIIHISSSSVRLVLSEIGDIGYIKKIDELKTPFDICYNLNGPCKIQEDKIDFLSSTIKTYKSLCNSSAVDKIFAIATQSFNLILDNHLIVSMLKDEFDLELKILSYEEEIYYGYLGVLKSFSTDNSLLIDINGTSTSLAWIKGNKIEKSTTLPFGNNNLTYNFKTDDRIVSGSLLECLSYIKHNLSSIEWLNNEFDSILLIGDVATNIAKIIKIKKRYPFDSFNKFEIIDSEIDELYNLIKSIDLKKRNRIEGLEPEMANTLFSSLAIFNVIIKKCYHNNLFLSNNSLREGILYEYLNNNYTVIGDNLEYSIFGILHSLNCNITHAKQVHWITSSLFKALKPVHNLSDSYLNILKTGSMLHDCGTSINYQHHHYHSFYIILNSNINELSHKELLMSAAIAASHRFNNYNIPLCQFSSIINKLDLAVVEKIGILLKIAEGLDRSLISTVTDIETHIYDDEVEILLTSSNNLDVEIHQALRAKEYFKDVYKKDLVIRAKNKWQ